MRRKIVAWALGVVGFLSPGVPGSAAVLTLLDWNTIVVSPGADHADVYEIPIEIQLSEAMPVTQIEIDYLNLPFVSGMGIHEIKSAQFLFNAGDLASTTVFENTPERFRALIVFNTVPDNRWLTRLTDRFAPAFAAYHGPASGSATTSAKWTVTFQNGATQTAFNGIIPEPSVLAALSFSCLAWLSRRRACRATSGG